MYYTLNSNNGGNVKMSLYFDSAIARFLENNKGFAVASAETKGMQETAILTDGQVNAKIVYSPDVNRFLGFRVKIAKLLKTVFLYIRRFSCRWIETGVYRYKIRWVSTAYRHHSVGNTGIFSDDGVLDKTLVADIWKFAECTVQKVRIISYTVIARKLTVAVNSDMMSEPT